MIHKNADFIEVKCGRLTCKYFVQSTCEKAKPCQPSRAWPGAEPEFILCFLKAVRYLFDDQTVFQHLALYDILCKCQPGLCCPLST